MKIGKKTMFATMPAAALLAFSCLASVGSAHAGTIIIGGRAGTVNGMTVCDCTQAPAGCGCAINTPPLQE